MEVKKTILWYVISVIVFLGLSVLVVISNNDLSYDEIGIFPWSWFLIKFFMSVCIPLVVPLPHLLISFIYRGRKDLGSSLKIIRGWLKAFVVAWLVFGVMGIVVDSPNAFCNSVLSREDNQKALEEFYDNNSGAYEGNAVRYGKNADPYRKYSDCISTHSNLQCWSKLVKTDVTTRRDAVELQLSIGVILHECQKK